MTALDEFDSEVWAQSSIQKIIARAMARPDFQTFKFDGEMVRNSKPLWDWAEYIIDHYAGTFELMVEFRTKQRLGRQMSENQLKVALNCLLKAWKGSLTETKTKTVFDQPSDFDKIPMPVNPTVAVEKPQAPTMQLNVQRPHDGTYTFVDQNGDYRVIRFQSNENTTINGKPVLTTRIQYQYGPDNDSDFATCGKIDHEGKLIVYKSVFLRGAKIKDLTGDQRADLAGAISFICSFDKDAQLKAGEAYALKSGNCFICNRTLTVPSSISNGIGPVCAKRWGM